MPTLRRRNSDTLNGSRAPLRSSLADAAWAVEDRVVWGAADVFHSLVEAIREEVELWGRPARAAALAGMIVLAGAGAAAGVFVSDPSGDQQAGPDIVRVSPPPVPTAPSAKTAEATGGPVLQGSTPSFGEEQGGGVTKAEAATEPPVSQIAANATDVAGEPSASAAGDGGSEVAGPAAIAVAREFAGAFVLYETGRDTAAVKAVFHKTATPELAKALLQRPPRLPADVKVPEAKVLNIVAGPRHGDIYTLSVSLLRVGVTSELRLNMQKAPSGNSAGNSAGSGNESAAGSDEPAKVRWLVTDVLG